MNRHFSKNTVKNVFALHFFKKIDHILLYVVYLIIKLILVYNIFFYYKHIKKTSKDVSSNYEVDINFGFK